MAVFLYPKWLRKQISHVLLMQKRLEVFFVFFLLSILTLGIYAIVWNVKVTERHAENLRSNSEKEILTGGGWLLWHIFGVLLLGLGPIIAMYKQIKQWNRVNKIYNSSRREQRSIDRAERKQQVGGSMKPQQAYGAQKPQPAYSSNQRLQPSYGSPMGHLQQDRGIPMPYSKFIMPRYDYWEKAYNGNDGWKTKKTRN